MFEGVFKAGIYVGYQALRVGLVDGVGSFEDALRMARPVAKIERPKRALFPLLSFAALKAILEGALGISPEEVKLVLAPGVYYLWFCNASFRLAALVMSS